MIKVFTIESCLGEISTSRNPVRPHINKSFVEIAIIPHTFKNTTLYYKNIGDYLNVETDIFSKMIEKQLKYHIDNETK